MLVAKVKLFRMKYSISLAELGSACGISLQRIHEIENAVYAITPATVEKVCHGMDAVLKQRQAWVNSLQTDLNKHGYTLLEFVEENSYEL